MYLSESILYLCCIPCCMEDWWWTLTSLTEYWSNTWLSELLRLLAEWCDSQWWAWARWWTTWLVVNTEMRRVGLGESACFPVWSPFRQEVDTFKPFKSGIMKTSITEFPLSVSFLFYFVTCQYVNTMATGDKRDEEGGFCLIQRPGMLFSFNLGTNSCDEVHGTIHA